MEIIKREVNQLPILNTAIDTVKQVLQGQLVNKSSDHQLSNTLLFIYNLIGLRPQHFPSITDDKILFSFIRSEYGNKTLDELILAFKLAIKDELDIEDAKVYDQFTCEYIARVMTAYRKWLKKVNNEVKPEPKMVFHNSITTQEEKLSDIAEWESKENVVLDLIPPYIYDYLTEFEKIQAGRVEKWKAMAKATEIRKEKLYEESLTLNKKAIDDYNNFLVMFSTGEYVGDEVNRLKLLAKKIMVFDYLKKLSDAK